MHRHGHNETIKFNNLSGYYGSIPDGYGGFDWSSDILYVSASDFQNQCDTGFTNVCRGSGEAFVYDYGLVVTANPKETFNLQSMIAAAAWSSNQSWELIGYTYNNGVLAEKGDIQIKIGQTAQHINFSKLDKGGFTKISVFAFEALSYGSPGNSCTYGAGTYGLQLVFDNLKVHWNGKIPGGHPEFARGSHLHAHHPVIAMLPVFHPQSGISDHGQSGIHAGGAAGNSHGTWHSQLVSLDAALGHHGAGGLTDQFALPQPDHFGT